MGSSRRSQSESEGRKAPADAASRTLKDGDRKRVTALERRRGAEGDEAGVAEGAEVVRPARGEEDVEREGRAERAEEGSPAAHNSTD